MHRRRRRRSTEAALARELGRGRPADAVDGLPAAVRSAGAPANAASAVLDLVG